MVIGVLFYVLSDFMIVMIGQAFYEDVLLQSNKLFRSALFRRWSRTGQLISRKSLLWFANCIIEKNISTHLRCAQGRHLNAKYVKACMFQVSDECKLQVFGTLQNAYRFLVVLSYYYALIIIVTITSKLFPSFFIRGKLLFNEITSHINIAFRKKYINKRGDYRDDDVGSVFISKREGR